MSDPTVLRITAPPEAAGQRVDRFLAEAIGTMSRSQVKALILGGHVTAGGARLAEPAELVRAGWLYELTRPPPVPTRLEPQRLPFTLLFEDEHLLVIDKPAGLVVHPAPGNEAGTLVNALLAHCGDTLPGIGGERRPGIVHRLDKDTSGVMVVAKSAAALAGLAAGFASHALDRAYLALAWGVPSAAQGEIEGPIGRDPRDRKRMAVLRRGGKPALTRYRILEGFEGGVSLLECRLATGRTHQIRVHLASRGHPLVGDPVYLRRVPAAAKAISEPLRGRLLDFPRQALHAARLGFTHPVSGGPLCFETPPPADFASLLADLRASCRTPGAGRP